MDGIKTTFREKYRLRQVADMYWLIDVTQPGVPYKPPLTVNQVGAVICGMLEGGADQEQIAEALSAEYEIPIETAREDVEQFLERLEGL